MCCKKKQMKQGKQKRCINCLYRSNAKMWMCVGGIRSKKVKKDFDYSYYLGPDYQNQFRKDIHTSTIISNHVSWFDTMNIF